MVTVKEAKKIFRQNIKSGKRKFTAMVNTIYREPGNFDMQYIENMRTGSFCYYADKGETYAETLLCIVTKNGRYSFRRGSWGDLVETGRWK